MQPVTLRLYTKEDRANFATWLRAFNLFHAQLFEREETISEEELCDTLVQWQTPSHEIYIIEQNAIPCGFIHIDLQHTPIVKIEQIYVDETLRRQGIATKAIQCIETQLQEQGDLQAITMEVSPRNLNAMHLYHALGYDNLCLLTLRKEWKENPRNQDCVLFDHKFHM